ncbi:Phosphoribosylanthranilate isomerase [hydrothermal vent metagenome]|uniref:phosphoribosylanthranilate isomerase n=1 Tax=hydrothermal vent metagenome TaxID=652676 RepID=A0A3B0ZS16_9ZZZZ
MRVRTKICGITRPEDGVLAAELGVDAIGLVFYSLSPRAVTGLQAREIVAALPPFVSTVGLFVNATETEVRVVLEAVSLDVLQFHGEETPAQCQLYNKPYIKAIRMQAETDISQLCIDYADAAGLLLDAYHPRLHGGTGQPFDWGLFPQHVSKPLILAGGLTPDNIVEAIDQTSPFAVDVSGGVELAKGLKDAAKMAAFIKRCNEC